MFITHTIRFFVTTYDAYPSYVVFFDVDCSETEPEAANTLHDGVCQSYHFSFVENVYLSHDPVGTANLSRQFLGERLRS